MPLHVSSTCAHHQEVKIALHSPWHHHTYRWPSRAQFYNKFISCLYMFRAPCAHHQEVKIALHSLWYHHTYRWPSLIPKTLRKLVSPKRCSLYSYIHGVTSQNCKTAVRTSDSGQGSAKSNVKLGTVAEACWYR